MPTVSAARIVDGGSIRFLVDTSVWARLRTAPAARLALEAIVGTYSPRAIMVCAPVVAELGFSARNGPDHSALIDGLSAFPDCARAPSAADALALQNSIWNAGLVRSVGAMDVLIASYALANDATVLHYDSDFEHVATVSPSFAHRWIVPRGSIS